MTEGVIAAVRVFFGETLAALKARAYRIADTSAAQVAEICAESPVALETRRLSQGVGVA